MTRIKKRIRVAVAAAADNVILFLYNHQLDSLKMCRPRK